MAKYALTVVRPISIGNVATKTGDVIGTFETEIESELDSGTIESLIHGGQARVMPAPDEVPEKKDEEVQSDDPLNLPRMTVDELTEYAASIGLDVPKNAKKPELIKLIEAAHKAG